MICRAKSVWVQSFRNRDMTNGTVRAGGGVMLICPRRSLPQLIHSFNDLDPITDSCLCSVSPIGEYRQKVDRSKRRFKPRTVRRTRQGLMVRWGLVFALYGVFPLCSAKYSFNTRSLYATFEHYSPEVRTIYCVFEQLSYGRLLDCRTILGLMAHCDSLRRR